MMTVMRGDHRQAGETVFAGFGLEEGFQSCNHVYYLEIHFKISRIFRKIFCLFFKLIISEPDSSNPCPVFANI